MHSDFNVAVHALVYLKHKGVSVRSEELAHNICTNASRVRKVLARLRKADLIDTKEGADGGYAFPADREDISLEEVRNALLLLPIDVSWSSGSQEIECLVSKGMAGEMERIYKGMNQVCEQYLAQCTIQQITERIFGNGGDL